MTTHRPATRNALLALLTLLIAAALIATLTLTVQAQTQEVTPTAAATGESPPAKPMNVAARSVNHDSVTIGWTASTDQTVTHYAVLRRDRDNDAVGTFHVVDPNAGSGTSYTDNSVSASGSYVYRVKSVSPTGVSQWSGYTRANTPAAPAATPQPTATAVPDPSTTPDPEPETTPEPEPAEEEGEAQPAPDWSAVLTVGALSNDDGSITIRGYSKAMAGLGNLAPKTFAPRVPNENGGKTEVTAIIVLGSRLTVLAKPIPQTAFAIELGTSRYESTAATTSTDAGRTAISYSWTNAGLTWTADQSVAVTLRWLNPPDAPAITALTQAGGALTVSWTAPADTGDGEVTSYDVRHIASEATDKADADWTLVNGAWSSGAREHELNGLTNGTGYDVQVRATNRIGNGPWSETITGTPQTVPGAPALWPGAATSQRIEVLWSSPESDGGSPITSYDLRYIRADAPDLADENWTQVDAVSTVASSYNITDLTNGLAYHTEVRAINGAGKGPWSERMTRTPAGPPGIPAVETVANADASLVITWSAPETDGGSAVTGYNLRYVRGDAGNFDPSSWTVANGIWSSGALTYTLTGLVNEVRYRLSLQAVNAQGTSNWSNLDHVRTGTPGVTPTLPGAPDATGTAWNEDDTLTVSWTPPEDDGDADVTSYDVRYIESGAEFKSDSYWTVADDAWTSGDLEHVITGIRADVKHDVQVRAQNSAGQGPWSDTTQSTGATVPGQPSCCLFAFWDETLWLSWSNPDHDGGAGITHYEVRLVRTDVEATPFLDTTTDHRYQFNGLTNHVEYKMQVRAVNRAGSGPWIDPIYVAPRKEVPAPANVRTEPGNGEIKVTWSTPPTDDDMTISYYHVQYVERSKVYSTYFWNWPRSGQIPATGALEYTITGLTNGVMYEIQVVAHEETYGDTNRFNTSNAVFSTPRR